MKAFLFYLNIITLLYVLFLYIALSLLSYTLITF